MCFRFVCGKHCMHNDGQRRAKTAGESQLNQKAWGCPDLMRAYTVSSQIVGKSLLLVRTNLTMRDSLQSAAPFLFS